MNSLQMQDLIREICRSNEIDCKVMIEYSRHIAHYNSRVNTIYFNPDRCINMADKMGMNIEDFLAFITYHEIGHYLDFSSGNYSNSKLEREIAAWELSRVLVSESDLTAYDIFNEVNLRSYRRVLNG